MTRPLASFHQKFGGANSQLQRNTDPRHTMKEGSGENWTPKITETPCTLLDIIIIRLAILFKLSNDNFNIFQNFGGPPALPESKTIWISNSLWVSKTNILIFFLKIVLYKLSKYCIQIAFTPQRLKCSYLSFIAHLLLISINV